MINKHFKSLLTTGCVMAAVVGSASAGGFSRGNADTDILYEPGNFDMRISATIVSPTRKLETVNPLLGPASPNLGHDYADTYVIPSAAVKFKVLENLSCAATAVQSYGADASYAGFYGGPPLVTTGEHLNVMEYGATCGVNVSAGSGRAWFLGGVYTEQFKYETQILGTPNFLRDSSSFGWRLGVAYEIPEVALRAQLMYRSGTSISAANANALLPIQTLSTDLPQTVELKVQSGVAPGWLVFGSVKWVDWSVLSPLVNGAIPLPYNWKDGWTVSAGVGHAFTEKVSGTAFLSWDRGVSTGFDLYGDVITVGAGLALKDSFGGELRVGGAVFNLGSVANTNGYSVGNDWGASASAGYVVRW